MYKNQHNIFLEKKKIHMTCKEEICDLQAGKEQLSIEIDPDMRWTSSLADTNMKTSMTNMLKDVL